MTTELIKEEVVTNTLVSKEFTAHKLVEWFLENGIIHGHDLYYQVKESGLVYNHESTIHNLGADIEDGVIWFGDPDSISDIVIDLVEDIEIANGKAVVSFSNEETKIVIELKELDIKMNELEKKVQQIKNWLKKQNNSDITGFEIIQRGTKGIKEFYAEWLDLEFVSENGIVIFHDAMSDEALSLECVLSAFVFDSLDKIDIHTHKNNMTIDFKDCVVSIEPMKLTA